KKVGTRGKIGLGVSMGCEYFPNYLPAAVISFASLRQRTDTCHAPDDNPTPRRSQNASVPRRASGSEVEQEHASLCVGRRRPDANVLAQSRAITPTSPCVSQRATRSRGARAPSGHPESLPRSHQCSSDGGSRSTAHLDNHPRGGALLGGHPGPPSDAKE